MEGKKRDNGGDFNNVIIHPNRMVLRQTSAIKYKVLPSIKHNTNLEPINFKLYERVKKYKKMMLIKEPSDIKNLFLEGEIAYSAPTHHRRQGQQNVIDMLTIPREDRREGRRVTKIFMETKTTLKVDKNSVVVVRSVNPSHEGSFKEKTIKKYIPSIYNTFQHNYKSDVSQKKEKEESLNKSVCNLNVEQDVNSQRPAVYLDKKQLAQIKAESFIVMEYPSMKIVTGNRFKNNAEIASLTKIMTFYTVHKLSCQKNINISEQLVTVDEEVSEMTGTTAELVTGDQLSVQQLLYGLMLPSGNDAALALAKWAGGLVNTNPEEVTAVNAFIGLMNRYVKSMGLKQSVFGNPHGLPNYKNTSNPFDLAILISQCLKIPLFCKIVSTQTYSIWITNDKIKKQIIWQNTNKLLRRQGFIGVKTGVTVTAGPCLATCFQHKDKKFIIVLLRTTKLSRRFKQTRLILGWSLRRYNSDFHELTKQILKHDIVLDSDNSEDEEQFCYEKMDAEELAKRNKILVYEL